MTTTYQRAEKYLAKVPSAPEGQRNDSLNKLSYQILERFDLTETDFEQLMLKWSQSCSPPIADSEALKTIRSAWRAAHGKGVIGSKAKAPTHSHPQPKKSPAQPKPAPKSYALDDADLPEPIDNGAVMLLEHCFQPGEGVRIVNARMDEDGHEVPDGAGPCLSREEWLRKLSASKGNPNAIFSSSKKTGIYIAINPLKVGGSKDQDVTDYRHALVEFDDGLSPAQQWSLYQQTKLPCAAIIYSGGKSVHAWVKIGAATRQEYDDRVKALYTHFESSGFHLDIKNKNPGRLSRLPNCVRFSNRQSLLALNQGPDSFTEWLKIIAGDDLGECKRFSDLIDLDTTKDPNCVIGFRQDGTTLRYLCRGKSAWLLGPSGIGKSSLISEFAIAWALGLPAYGIGTGGKNLKSLIVQGENDEYDLAEIAQGIASAHDLDFNDGARSIVNDNVLFKTETKSVGDAFVDRLHRLIDRERPDIVWLDPLLSFAGIDVNRQDQVTHFLRVLLNPVLEATGVVLVGVHHTGKPKNQRETANWTAIDWAYSGLGSSELVNWSRAVMHLHPVSNHQFELKLAKRGSRAGALDLAGTYTTSLWLQHSTSGIRWEQIAEPEKPSEESKSKKKTSNTEALAGSNLHDILSKIPAEGESARSLGKRLSTQSRKNGKTVSEETCRKTVLDLLVSNGKLTFDAENELYMRGKNA